MVLIADHAMNRLPPRYGNLGLPESAFERHIAFDIGVEALTRQLAGLLGVPAVLGCFSRLLIDPNRGEDDPTLVMKISDGAIIPGNHPITSEEWQFRLHTYHRPYHAAVERTIARAATRKKAPLVLSLHSFTPYWKNVARPWHAAVLWDTDHRAVQPLLSRLREPGDIVVGDNEPYDGALKGDTMYRHCMVPGIPHALLEVRQDLIGDDAGIGDALMTELSSDQQTALEAAAFRRLVQHLRQRTDVQNIDLMNLAGFCRNCLSNWYRDAAVEAGLELSKEQSREIADPVRAGRPFTGGLSMPHHDVIIVGAGFTGLSAATSLLQAGANVIVLEARGRAGGRVEAQSLPDGTRVDSGGQFFCRDMSRVVNLAAHHGAKPVWTFAQGRQAWRPAIPPEDSARLLDDVSRLRNRLRRLDPEDPSLARLTVADWVEVQSDMPEDARRAYQRLVTGLWCRSPADIALAYLVSNDRRITNTQSELELFLPGTMHALAERLGAQLGDRLHLSSPVTSIRLTDQRAEVASGSHRFTAAQVIVAVPPVMARRIAFAPLLPQRTQKALDAWSPGDAIKVQIGYSRPFWRDQGLSGSVMWRNPAGLYACDASSEDHAALVVFLGGPLARHWHARPQTELLAYVTGEVAPALGDEARSPRWTIVRDWVDDAWSGGAYSDVITDLDATDAEAVLLEGLPRLRFACSELSPSFPGYVEGAIASGEEAAQLVLRGLRQGV
eukprot:g7598.t1